MALGERLRRNWDSLHRSAHRIVVHETVVATSPGARENLAEVRAGSSINVYRFVKSNQALQDYLYPSLDGLCEQTYNGKGNVGLGRMRHRRFIYFRIWPESVACVFVCRLLRFGSCSIHKYNIDHLARLERCDDHGR